VTQQLDETKLHVFIGKMLGDIGGAMSVPTTRIGFRLGLFDELAKAPATSAELAERAGGLLHAAALANGLGATARDFVRREGTKERMVEETLRAYKELVPRP